MKNLNFKKLTTLPKGKYHDGDGLYITLTMPGKGKWSFRYRFNKKPREMGLGKFPNITLLEARQFILFNKQLLGKGIDPIDEKNRVEVLRQQQSKKFSDIARLYIETKKKPEWTNNKSEQQWINTINTYASPILDKKPLVDINRDDIISVLYPIWSKKTETARRLQQRLFLIFAFAKIRQWYINDNPASWKEHLSFVLSDPYKIHKVKHFPSLHFTKIANFYEDLYQFENLSAYALRFLILTATRTKEVIEAKFDEFDLERRMWTIPAEKMKVRKEHKVPLSEIAIKIIEFMKRKHNHEYVFHNPAIGKHISNGAMLVFLKKQFPHQSITVHGFRATFRDWAEETGNYSHHAIEFCLAHQLPNKVEKAYLRTDLTEQRKKIMNDWEKYLSTNIA
ncbi:tyrosine-type recombinase/integrase [Alphaproteobacteria bacterium]|nr:tyrosine-type recombinase/integrase [Alphaproteobacteria bacterium]